MSRHRSNQKVLGSAVLFLGDCRDVMTGMEDCSVDSIVTDSPYELGFMGKRWDASGIAYQVDVWAECLRVLKPGGHLLAFGGTRTYHRMACAIEDAGFEIRDSIHWIYGSGFPKSLDISKAIDKEAGAESVDCGPSPNNRPAKRKGAMKFDKALGEGKPPADIRITAPSTPNAKKWDGWGTALKPAHEPIVVARKPLTGTVAKNVIKHGTGGLNIDGCRVRTKEELTGGRNKLWSHYRNGKEPSSQRRYFDKGSTDFAMKPGPRGGDSADRWPSNVILDEEAGRVLDKQSGELKSGKMKAGQQRKKSKGKGGYHDNFPDEASKTGTLGDKGGASRFFYCAKTGGRCDIEKLKISGERHAGCEELYWLKGKRIDKKQWMELRQENIDRKKEKGYKPHKIAWGNIHPTVKPLTLMQYLVRLVTPFGGIILDPFVGSGTTGIAAYLENFRFIGIDKNECESFDIAIRRIRHWQKRKK